MYGLAALLPAPPVTRRGAWIRAPHPSRDRGRELTAGVWVCQATRWRDTSVFDRNAEVPMPTDVDPRPRTYPYPSWHEWALCRGMPVSVFFGAATEERPTMKRSELSAARRVCAACPVKQECLSWSLSPLTLEKHGVWAGTSGRQRALMRKQLHAGTDLEVVIKSWFAKWLET